MDVIQIYQILKFNVVNNIYKLLNYNLFQKILNDYNYNLLTDITIYIIKFKFYYMNIIFKIQKNEDDIENND